MIHIMKKKKKELQTSYGHNKEFITSNTSQEIHQRNLCVPEQSMANLKNGRLNATV